MIRLFLIVPFLFSLFGACQGRAVPTEAPTITIAAPTTGPTSTPEIVAFVTKFGVVSTGGRAKLNGVIGGELAAPVINLWTQPDGVREVRCEMYSGEYVTVRRLAIDQVHALVRSDWDPACYGFVHIDFLEPAE